MRATGAPVDIARRYNRVNQLHESSRCVDGTSNTCLCKDFIRICFAVIGGTRLVPPITAKQTYY